MKRIILSVIVFGIMAGSFAQDITATLDTLLQAYTRLNRFNGTVLVAQQGKVLLEKGYGYRDAHKKIPHDPQSIFQIGSVTKQFTSAVILKLQETKLLSVQDPVSKFFPDYPSGDSITIAQLMSHTSGVYSYTNDRAFMQKEVSEPHSREQMMALFKDKPLGFTPGTSYSYSNSGYSLLGYIIEAVTKKPYEQSVRTYIFSPLRMTQSGFDFTHLTKKEKSVGYFSLNEKDTALSPIVDSTVAYSAGAIYSTTGDLYRWHQALQRNTVLTAAQQEQAYTIVRNRYGYGWNIDSSNGKRIVTHSGGIHGFTSKFARIPADDVCIILLSNSSSIALEEINKSILAILYNRPYTVPKERKAITLSADKLQQYVGTYTINPSLELVIELKDGGLLAKPTNQSPAVLYVEREDFLFVKQPDVQLQFTRNDKKEIDGFILFQNGRETKCPKIK